MDRMSLRSPIVIDLHLSRLSDFFVAPEFDPFSSRPVFASGFDSLFTQLKPADLRKRHRVVLHLPADELKRRGELQPALVRHCEHLMERNRHELRALHWDGIKSLQTGASFLAGCLLLSALLGEWTALPELLRRFLGEGLSIVGWVSMWHPVDILLYQWWPFRREIQMLKYIESLEFEFQEE